MAAHPEWLNPSSGGIKPNYALTITPDRQCGADQSLRNITTHLNTRPLASSSRIRPKASASSPKALVSPSNHADRSGQPWLSVLLPVTRLLNVLSQQRKAREFGKLIEKARLECRIIHSGSC